MTERDYEIARKLKRRWSERVPVVEMRVFGSRARGDNESDSDMDVFIEIERHTREIEEIVRDIAWETGLEYFIHVSPLIFSRDDVENSPMRSSPILGNVRKEGVMV
jgi:predicted nucleotidyltransferase